MHVAAEEQRNAAAVTHVERMKKHEHFPVFCAEVGAEEHLWGQDPEQAATEVSLFEEWLAEKEDALVAAASAHGASLESQAARSMDVVANAETQLEYNAVAWLQCSCVGILQFVALLEVLMLCHRLQPKEEAMAAIPRPPEDVDGEALGEVEEEPRSLRRSLDGDLQGADGQPGGSVIPGVPCVEMERIILEQTRDSAKTMRCRMSCVLCFFGACMQ